MKVLGLLFILWGSILQAGGYKYIPAEKFGLEELTNAGETPAQHCPGRKIGKSISSDLLATQDDKATLAVVVENREGEIKYVALRKKESLSTISTGTPDNRLLLGYIVLDRGSDKKKSFKIQLPDGTYNISLVSDVVVLGLKFEIKQGNGLAHLKMIPQKY